MGKGNLCYRKIYYGSGYSEEVRANISQQEKQFVDLVSRSGQFGEYSFGFLFQERILFERILSSLTMRMHIKFVLPKYPFKQYKEMFFFNLNIPTSNSKINKSGSIHKLYVFCIIIIKPSVIVAFFFNYFSTNDNTHIQTKRLGQYQHIINIVDQKGCDIQLICQSTRNGGFLLNFFFPDQTEITPTRRQTNTTELDNPRTWLALSVLELTISKENHGKMLRCVAVHESYSTKSSSIDVRLDVMCKSIQS